MLPRMAVGFQEKRWRVTLYKRAVQADGRVADVEIETFDDVRPRYPARRDRGRARAPGVRDWEWKRSSERRLCVRRQGTLVAGIWICSHHCLNPQPLSQSAYQSGC
jgi:hypothetical protein